MIGSCPYPQTIDKAVKAGQGTNSVAYFASLSLKERKGCVKLTPV
jgi:hypothetical protein